MSDRTTDKWVRVFKNGLSYVCDEEWVGRLLKITWCRKIRQKFKQTNAFWFCHHNVTSLLRCQREENVWMIEICAHAGSWNCWLSSIKPIIVAFPYLFLSGTMMKCNQIFTVYHYVVFSVFSILFTTYLLISVCTFSLFVSSKLTTVRNSQLLGHILVWFVLNTHKLTIADGLMFPKWHQSIA